MLRGFKVAPIRLDVRTSFLTPYLTIGNNGLVLLYSRLELAQATYESLIRHPGDYNIIYDLLTA